MEFKKFVKLLSVKCQYVVIVGCIVIYVHKLSSRIEYLFLFASLGLGHLDCIGSSLFVLLHK